MHFRTSREIASGFQWRAAMFVAAVLLGHVLPAAPGAAQERIGVDAAVNPQATGSPPGAASRTLAIGQEVLFNERLATGAAGQAQLVFLDQSALSIGPNSDVVVDQFVYDPTAAAGKLALSATRGAFRFVGGKLSKAENGVTLTTPSGSLGIRGGIFLAEIDPNGALTVVLIYGELTVTGRNGTTTTVKRPGFGVRIERPGASPSEPVRIEREKLAALTALFDGRAGSSAGARERPTDAKVTATALYRELEQHRIELPREREIREAEFHRLRAVGLGRLEERLHLSTVAKQVIAQRFPALFGLSR
jgi:trimeric autotransporter adhesin